MKPGIIPLGFLFALYIASSWSTSTVTPAAQRSDLHWYKGNTHTHTLNSDGDSTPDEMVRWYRAELTDSFEMGK
jgi:hypothetical protein